MGSAGCRAAPLKSQSAGEAACYTIDAVICSLPGRRSARELDWTSVLLILVGLRRFELGAMLQHGMHDNGETTGKRDARLTHRRAPGDGDSLVLQLQRPLVACQHHVRDLIQQRAQPPVAALRDAARIVDFA
jgi:hypothetical protein